MKRKVPSVCPVCGGEYEITKCTCVQCGSELAGHFTGCDFCALSDEDAYFTLTFIKCRGSIKEVEKELGISYPTVRSRLDAVIGKLGLKPALSAEELKEERRKVFERLENGEITADQAAEALRNL